MLERFTSLKFRLIAMIIATIPIALFGFFTNTLYGILLLAIGLYLLSPYIFGTNPSFSSLGEFAANNPEISLAAAGIVFGYFIALLTWRRQKLVELRLSAGGEISDFFEQAQYHSITLDSFARSLVEAKDAADTGRLLEERWRLSIIRDQIPAALEARTKLRFQGRAVHTLHQKYRILTSSSFLAQRALPKAVDALSELSILALFYMPPLDGTDEDIDRMLSIACDASWRTYLDENCRLAQKMSMNAGAIHGIFQHPIMISNLALLWSQVCMIRELQKISEDDLISR